MTNFQSAVELPPFEDQILKVVSWSIVILLAIIVGIIVLNRSRKGMKEFEMRRQYFSMGGIIMFGFAAIRICFLLSDFEFWTQGTQTLLHYQYVYAGYTLLFVSFYFMIHFFDKYFINSYKQIISKIQIGLIFLCMCLFFALPILLPYEEITRYVLYLVSYYAFLIQVIVITKVLIHTKIKGLTKFLWSFLGFLLIALALVLDTALPLPIGPIIVIIGIVFVARNAEITIILLSEYYTAKKICLVHRGEITGKLIFCPNCFVQYCVKCFKSVISIENKCWVCEHIFDKDILIETVPIKEEVHVEDIGKTDGYKKAKE